MSGGFISREAENQVLLQEFYEEIVADAANDYVNGSSVSLDKYIPGVVVTQFEFRSSWAMWTMRGRYESGHMFTLSSYPEYKNNSGSDFLGNGIVVLDVFPVSAEESMGGVVFDRMTGEVIEGRSALDTPVYSARCNILSRIDNDPRTQSSLAEAYLHLILLTEFLIPKEWDWKFRYRSGSNFSKTYPLGGSCNKSNYGLATVTANNPDEAFEWLKKLILSTDEPEDDAHYLSMECDGFVEVMKENHVALGKVFDETSVRKSFWNSLELSSALNDPRNLSPDVELSQVLYAVMPNFMTGATSVPEIFFGENEHLVFQRATPYSKETSVFC